MSTGQRYDPFTLFQFSNLTFSSDQAVLFNLPLSHPFTHLRLVITKEIDQVT